MKSLPFRLVLIIAALSLGACQKKEKPPEKAASAAAESPAPAPAPKVPAPLTVDVVKESERSRNFAVVNQHLELGGTLYGYVDIDGDVLRITTQLQGFLTEMAKAQPGAAGFAQQNLPEIATMLGLTDVRALGVSSVPDGTGFYRNRLFIHTSGERRGLMAMMGGSSGPLKHIHLAPADAVFFGEADIDLAALYRTLKDVVTKVSGEPMTNQLETALKSAGEAVAISYLDLIYGLKGRVSIIARVDQEKAMHTGGVQDIVLPVVSALGCIEGIGQIVEPSLAKMPGLRRSDVGTMHVYTSTTPSNTEGFEPSIVIDGKMLYVTTSLAFFNECREQKSGLAQTAEFQQALAHVGADNNGLTYVSPRLFARIRDLEKMNPDLPAQAKLTLGVVLAHLPTTDRPLVAARINLEDGILVRSYLNRSMKQDIAAVSIYNPVTVGLMAAMAIPAFQKVRMSSQDKAVLNNLRQLAAAADQYYLETGTDHVTYDQLVNPDSYIKSITPVAGEDYRALQFRLDEPLRVELLDGRTIQYPEE